MSENKLTDNEVEAAAALSAVEAADAADVAEVNESLAEHVGSAKDAAEVFESETVVESE